MNIEKKMPDLGEWNGDALGRKALADHLTTSLTAQAGFQSEHYQRGITVALDADWGAGKTFFVKKWVQDLKALKHPVVYFDAWENDIGDEASIALMAAVLGELEEWRSGLPTATNIQAKAAALRKKSISKLRKAVIPVAGVVIKGLIKRAAGFGLDELSAAYAQSAHDEFSNEGDDTVESTLDKVFEEALAEHESRKDALASFKIELKSLLDLLTEHTDAQPPLFVFVDELDRCRPSYAIKLLEEIKHVFGIEHVVYIVSTNIEQLQNSVRALYGSDFDGRRYLHRLFDREYFLPTADNRQFANVAVRQNSVLACRKTHAGLPRMPDASPSMHDSWSVISDAFGLDFRTQRQVFELADEASTGIVDKNHVHALWLFFLCALKYFDSQLLERISQKELSRQEFDQTLVKVFKRDLPISFRRPAGHRSDLDYEIATVPLSKVLTIYFDAAQLSARDLLHKEVNLYDYPNNIYREIAEEYGGVLHGNTPPPSIGSYAKLVRTAGYLTH